jgi:hypothetical protein
MTDRCCPARAQKQQRPSCSDPEPAGISEGLLALALHLMHLKQKQTLLQ